MPKLMFITPPVDDPPLGGRALLSRLHEDSLRALLGSELVIHELPSAPFPGVRQYKRAALAYIDGVSGKSVEEVLQRIRAERINRVFLNGSNLGRLAWSIRRRMPSVEVITFFHNVEARFFLGAFRAKPSVRSLGVLFANYQAERLAVMASDRCIVLNDRDAKVLGRLYEPASIDLLPMAIEDGFVTGAAAAVGIPADDYLLFVGGAFYANLEGIRWFARRVAPHLRIQTCVVGRGFEAHKLELEQAGTLRVIGAVDTLAPWYLGAKVVIAPIFDGSGMKTKVAEALMFGKQIVGTAEAFVGYEETLPDAGWVCEDDHAFIRTLREIEVRQVVTFIPQLRAMYETRYSRSAIETGLGRILADRDTCAEGIRAE